ncbi:DUF1642 domain-containing protein [Stenotrophomonas sp. Sm10]|uniref:DUF1642 domain-containing protein n=1 Tax=Stenotrophomonas sp. Sm10 TaxID=3002754 RepID=UPI0027E4BC52|nr:DUF1642 domain-containing protein [Stenotrophomonas sp. Sm10]MDQ7313697.1 DUF1642 domain-containing protein [Stenotrophomonas sp. Sm10]
MNKQELIDKYEAAECVVDFVSGKTLLKNIRRDLEQLDEPKPVKVPQVVADWIEVCKAHLTSSLYTAMNPNFMKENNQSFDLILWIKKTSNQEIFARAWIFGYEVDEEKRYLVKIKASNQYIMSNPDENAIFFYSCRAYSKLTRKELEEAGFGWVFDCEGIEIEEVE